MRSAMGQPCHLHDPLQLFVVRSAMIQQAGEDNILINSQIGNQIIELIDNADVSASENRQFTFIHVKNLFNKDTAGCGAVYAADQIHKRRFSGA